MNAVTAATLILAGGAMASFNDVASNVYSAVSQFEGEINNWSSEQGVQGALAIQGNFPSVSSVLDSFSQAVGGLKAEDIDVQATHQVIAQLTGLLSSLTKKANDFSAVSLEGVAAGDLKALNTPTTDIVNGFLEALGQDQSKWNSLSDDFNGLEEGINSANKAYSVDELHFKADPTFASAASSSSSPSSTESASSETKASSVTAAAAETSSAASSQKNNTTTTTAATNGTVSHNSTGSSNSTNGTQSSTAVKNGGSIATVGVCGVAAGMVALLI